MDDILQQKECSELHPYVEQIQSALFGNLKGGGSEHEAGSLLPAEFIRSVANLRKTKLHYDKVEAKQQRYALPPLYRT